MPKPNVVLEKDVRDQLSWDPTFNDRRIVVKADDGRVTLTGAVDTYSDGRRASATARKVQGVKEVDNRLAIELTGPTISDFELESECVKALAGERLLTERAVVPVVRFGLVTLNGRVRRHFERQAAVHVVGQILGVRGIHNHIELTHELVPRDVTDRITKALKRKAVLDDSMITVFDLADSVYLDGIVKSWTAMDQAVDSAWAAPGVRAVINRLKIAA
jgi:osmotically-inducible protein OsmY